MIRYIKERKLLIYFDYQDKYLINDDVGLINLQLKMLGTQITIFFYSCKIIQLINLRLIDLFRLRG